MDKFVELLEEGVIIQGLITTVCVIAVAYLAVTNQPIPPFLADTTSLIIGFYFGAKVQQTIGKGKG